MQSVLEAPEGQGPQQAGGQDGGSAAQRQGSQQVKNMPSRPLSTSSSAAPPPPPPPSLSAPNPTSDTLTQQYAALVKNVAKDFSHEVPRHLQSPSHSPRCFTNVSVPYTFNVLVHERLQYRNANALWICRCTCTVYSTMHVHSGFDGARGLSELLWTCVQAQLGGTPMAAPAAPNAESAIGAAQRMMSMGSAPRTSSAAPADKAS